MLRGGPRDRCLDRAPGAPRAAPADWLPAPQRRSRGRARGRRDAGHRPAGRGDELEAGSSAPRSRPQPRLRAVSRRRDRAGAARWAQAAGRWGRRPRGSARPSRAAPAGCSTARRSRSRGRRTKGMKPSSLAPRRRRPRRCPAVRGSRWDRPQVRPRRAAGRVVARRAQQTGVSAGQQPSMPAPSGQHSWPSGQHPVAGPWPRRQHCWSQTSTSAWGGSSPTTAPSRSTSAGSASPTRGSPAARRLALSRRRAVLRGDPRQPDGTGEPAPVSLDPRPDQRLLGRGVHPGRARGARRPRRPVRVHRQPRQQPFGRGCATCSARSRPTRTRSSARDPAAPWSSTAARARARPSSRCTARRTCSTPTRASATGAAACCSSARTSPTWPTSPTCCPASARRACRPAPCATSSPRARTAAPEADPEVARLKSSADMVRAIEPAVRLYEEPPTEGDGRSRPRGPTSG